MTYIHYTDLVYYTNLMHALVSMYLINGDLKLSSVTLLAECWAPPDQWELSNKHNKAITCRTTIYCVCIVHITHVHCTCI